MSSQKSKMNSNASNKIISLQKNIDKIEDKLENIKLSENYTLKQIIKNTVMEFASRYINDVNNNFDIDKIKDYIYSKYHLNNTILDKNNYALNLFRIIEDI